MIKQVYLAIAEVQDGDSVFGQVYDTFQAAEDGAREMCRDLEQHMGWKVRPHVQDLEYVQD